MTTRPRNRPGDEDDDGLPDEGGPFVYREGSLTDMWNNAISVIRAAGVEGRDHQVAIAAMAAARFRAMGRTPRILIVGGPGTGRSQLMSATAQAMGLPVTSIAGTTLSPSGWEGLNLRTVMAAAPPRTVVAIDEIQHAISTPPRVSGNTIERVEHLAGDIAAMCDGRMGPAPGYTPAVVATASLPRLRIGEGGDISPDALREAGVHASVASLWTPIHLPPLSPLEIGSIVVTRALSDAAITSGMCDLEIVWSPMALRTLQRAAISDPAGGVRLGLSLVARAMDNALIGAVAMGIRERGLVTVSPEHVPGVEPAAPLPWVDHERGIYGSG